MNINFVGLVLRTSKYALAVITTVLAFVCGDMALSPYSGKANVADPEMRRAGFQKGEFIPQASRDKLLGGQALASPNKFDRVISVKDFGAAGDGIRDDSAAIQAAFDSATSNFEIVFPAGEYVLKKPVFISGKKSFRITMVGACRTHASYPVFSIGTSAGFVLTHCSNFVLTPRFICKESGDRGVAIELANCSNISVVNGHVDLLNVDDSANGAFLLVRANIADLLVADNYVRCGWGVLSTDEGGISRVTIRGNSFHGARGQNGADLIEFNEPTHGASYIAVVGNLIASTHDDPSGKGSIGIGFARASQVTIKDNVVHEIGRDGIHVEDGSQDVVIANNVISKVYNYGISVTDACKRVFIIGNNITMAPMGVPGLAKVAINVAGASRSECEEIHILDNFVDGVTTGLFPTERTSFGLLALYMDESEVRGNLFKRCNTGVFLDSFKGKNRVERNRFEECGYAAHGDGLLIGSKTNSETVIEGNTYLNNVSNDFRDLSTGAPFLAPSKAIEAH